MEDLAKPKDLLSFLILYKGQKKGHPKKNGLIVKKVLVLTNTFNVNGV